MKSEAGVIVGTALQRYSTCVVFLETFPAMLAPPVQIFPPKTNQTATIATGKLGNESGVSFSQKDPSLKQLVTLV